MVWPGVVTQHTSRATRPGLPEVQNVHVTKSDSDLNSLSLTASGLHGDATERPGRTRVPRMRRSIVAALRPRSNAYSAVVGSIVSLTSETRLAGNPPLSACSRTSSSLGAM